jgi:sulfate transport system permease protein
MLVVLFGPQRALGAWLKEAFGFSVIFAPPGIILALLFITFPFVVRAVQPVLLSLDRTQEDAAATLGANAWTIFGRITLPPLILPLTSGALLSFARAIGEFGAVVSLEYPVHPRLRVYVVRVDRKSMGASAMSIVMIAIARPDYGGDWLQRRIARSRNES